jgi:hypothetical protein
MRNHTTRDAGSSSTISLDEDFQMSSTDQHSSHTKRRVHAATSGTRVPPAGTSRCAKAGNAPGGCRRPTPELFQLLSPYHTSCANLRPLGRPIWGSGVWGFRGVVLLVVVGVFLGVVGSALARPALYVAAHQAAGRQVQKPGRFSAVVGYSYQCVAGEPCWVYVKGSRSANPNLPASWYLRVGGRRVKDSVFNLFVMDPRSLGWRRSVAAACPHRCFVDGLGTPSLRRTRPRLGWSKSVWISRAALVVKTVVASGDLVLPNSVGVTRSEGLPLIRAAGGRGSSESFGPRVARRALGRGHIWVQEKGDCLAKYRAYLRYRGAGDHFACYRAGHLPWDTGWLR